MACDLVKYITVFFHLLRSTLAGSGTHRISFDNVLLSFIKVGSISLTLAGNGTHRIGLDDVLLSFIEIGSIR
jgi:hypothetical protein